MKNRQHHQYDYDHELQHTGSSSKSVFTGLLIGGLIGAATALLMAPRSGEETRTEIRNKAVEYRDRTKDVLNETVTQAKSKATHLKEGVMEEADELRHRGKQVADQQLERVSNAAEAGRNKVQEY
jgi:gas vesicle protein